MLKSLEGQCYDTCNKFSKNSATYTHIQYSGKKNNREKERTQ